MTAAEDKLKRLYTMVENGLTELDDILKDRLAALKTDRDQAKEALERIKVRPKSHNFDDQAVERFGRLRIDIEQGELGADLTEMFIVANVVRHGEGSSCEKLKTIAPALWDDTNDYHDLLAGPRIPSEHLRMRTRDLARYTQVTTRFWGLADPLPMAVTDPPYRVEARGGDTE